MGLASVSGRGTAVNLIGLLSETSGAVHLASIALPAAHALIGLGLVIGTVPLLLAERDWAAPGAGAPSWCCRDRRGRCGRHPHPDDQETTRWLWTTRVGFIVRRRPPTGACSCQQSAPAETGRPSSAPRAGETPKDKVDPEDVPSRQWSSGLALGFRSSIPARGSNQRRADHACVHWGG